MKIILDNGQTVEMKMTTYRQQPIYVKGDQLAGFVVNITGFVEKSKEIEQEGGSGWRSRPPML